MRAFLWRGLVLALLAGCAANPAATQSTRPREAVNAPFALNGRIAVRHDGEHTSANVRWVHRVNEDDILLLAPFGQTVAHIHSNRDGVVLDTQDKHYSAQDVESLMQKALGWQLPLAGLRYWVLAMPSPDESGRVEREANGQISEMRQDGWEIRYTRYVAENADSLPSRMSLQRKGLELQLLVDEWEQPGE
jgi:outer membrane lipoprotein LolB